MKKNAKPSLANREIKTVGLKMGKGKHIFIQGLKKPNNSYLLVHDNEAVGFGPYMPPTDVS